MFYFYCVSYQVEADFKDISGILCINDYDYYNYLPDFHMEFHSLSQPGPLLDKPLDILPFLKSV